MVEFLEHNFLSQLVLESTPENNIFDLVIVSQDDIINNVIVGERLDSCDQQVVRAEIIQLMYLKIKP